MEIIILKSSILFLLFYVGTVNTFNTKDLKFVRYNQKTHVCCNGVVHPKPPASSQPDKFTQCCGQHLHTWHSHWSKNDFHQDSICCGNEIYRIEGKQTKSCCGSDAMDSVESICINGQVKINNTIENQNNRYYYNLCTNKEGLHEIYDNRIQLCCNGHLLTKPTNHDDCCGNITYNSQTNTCCNGILYKSHTLCCNNISFDSSKSRCCNGIIHPESYYNYNMQCCDKELYNTNTQLCCNDNRYYETAFTYEYKYKVVDLNKGNQAHAACCHLELYNPENEICTENGPQSRSAEKLKKCCGILFQQVRWNNVWVPVQHPTSKDLEIKTTSCGDEIYFDGTRYCFRDKIYQSLPQSCQVYTAGLHIFEHYDPATQICCSGIVLNITDDIRVKGKNSCCFEDKQDYF